MEWGAIARSSVVVSLRGVLLDFNGVLTSDLFAAYRAYCTAEGQDPDALFDLLTDDPQGHDLLVRLETGRIEQTVFEQAVGELLRIDGRQMIERICGYLKPERGLVDVIAQMRRAGVRTGVVSNSLGLAPFNPYAPWELSRRFDAIILSGEVGMRKPEPEIFALAVEAMGVAFAETVFVDDMAHNLEPARALGMTVVHHTSADATVAELRRLFGDVLTER
jgi:putative hydrolase of the HAD superfamily